MPWTAIALALLPDTAGAQVQRISADGSTIVGVVTPNSGPQQGVVWRNRVPAGVESLSGGYQTWAAGVNADGTVVGGQQRYSGLPAPTPHAVTWNASNAITDVNSNGNIADMADDGLIWVGAYSGVAALWNGAAVPLDVSSEGGHTVRILAISGDGSLVTGGLNFALGPPGSYSQIKPCYWDSAGTRHMLEMTGLAAGTAYEASSDGSKIIGNLKSDDVVYPMDGYRAVRWTNGTPEELESPLSLVADATGYDARGCSADGSVVCGIINAATMLQSTLACVWRADGHASVLPQPEGLPQYWALGVSGDGKTIIGGANAADWSLEDQPFIWTWEDEPPDFNLRCGPSTITSFTAQWDAVPGATGYEFQYQLPSGSWSDVITTTETFVVVSDLLPGTTYNWRVRVVEQPN